jgi:rhodanese-related sulfurtransferase/sugar phosphate permease
VTDAGIRPDTSPLVRSRFYYGWVVLGVAALAMVGTLPGRSQGLGLITEPLLSDLLISRVAFAQVNVVATLLGALFCFGVGRLIDRHGSRVVLTVTALLLGAVVLLMSRATSVLAIIALITLTRGLGQSSLSIISLAMVGKWFRRRLTMAMAVYAVAMSVGFMMVFPAVGALVQAEGWRVAWATVGGFIVLGLAPIAWLLDRSSPETIGVDVDGDASADNPSAVSSGDATLSEALASPAFWVFAVASSVYGLVASGIGLFNQSILGQRGFGPDVYYNALAVTAIAGLAGNFAAGAYADRGSLRRVLVASLVLMAVGLVGLVHVASVFDVMMQAAVLGVAGGFVMVVFFGFWGRAYGRTHLGRIQGAAQALTVLASAVGPLLLAYTVDATGSYAIAFYALAAVQLGLAVTALVVPVPRGAEASAAPTDPSADLEDARISSSELLAQIVSGLSPLILDVRSKREYEDGHVPGAVHLPFWASPGRSSALGKASDAPLVVYCGHGPRARLSAARLRRHGFSRVVLLAGHWSAWRKQGLPVER